MKSIHVDKPIISVLSQIVIFYCILTFFVPCGADAKIAYIAYGSIYVMNDDGSDKKRLTDNQYWEFYPRWSPDGKRITFQRHLEKDTQKFQLFVMNADGTEQQQLTHNDQGDKNGGPSWSPDGKYLAFKSNRTGLSQIYVMELESKQTKQLTGVEGELGSYTPDWSPDGKEIVYGKFVESRHGLSHKAVWIMSADGQNQRPFLPDPDARDELVFRSNPLWASDGERILFYESRGGLGRHIKKFVILTKGGIEKEIDIDEKIGGEWAGAGLSWMDNGNAILFGARRTDVPEIDHDIYKYEIETSRLRRLTSERSLDRNPDWIEGPLSVSSHGKLPTQWGDMKAEYLVEIPQN